MKRFFLMVLVLLMVGSPALAAGFDDVPDDHLFAEDIEWLAESGITRGCNPPENTNFCPNDAVSRGEMAAFLVRGLGLTQSGPEFDDTNGSVFEEDISKLAQAGITRGCNPPDNTNFCPNDNVTRGEMAAFLVRGLELTEAGPEFDDTNGSVFEEDISKLAEAGITRGCNPPDNTNFCPNDNVTRGQMAAFLRRALADGTNPPPPGQQVIVFQSDRTGDLDIFSVRPDGSGLKNLTANRSGDDDHPALSPDGRQIAFSSGPAGGDTAELYIMNIDGSGVRQLTDEPHGWAGYPAWSPDGSRIAYSADPGPDEYPALFVINVDGSGRRLVVDTDDNDVEATWSPDGSEIGYTSWSYTFVPPYIYPSAEAWIHPADGAGTAKEDGRQVLPTNLEETDLVWFGEWSPDGRTIVLRGEEQPLDYAKYVSDLFAVDSGKVNGSATAITNTGGPEYEYSPAFSPDGRSLVFSEFPQPSSDDFRGEIKVINLNGSGLRTLVTAPNTGENLPDW